MGTRRARSSATSSSRSSVLWTRCPVSADVKITGAQRSDGARSRRYRSNAGAVPVSFSTRSHLFTTTTSPHPAFQAFSAIFRSWTWTGSVPSTRSRQTSARSTARSVRSAL